MKNKILKPLLNGLLKENPTFVLMLGMCPTLAVTTSAISGMGMGLTTMVVLALSNVIISLLRNIIPNKVRIPAFIVIIASFVTMVELLLQAYIPSLYDALGIYIPLIVVNCIILGRAESFASKNPVIPSFFDGVGMGLGFLLALLVMAFIREVFGAGAFFGIELPFMAQVKIPALTQAPGGFLVFGIVIAVMNKLTEKRGGVKRKSFSCEGCPSAHICNKTSCSEMEETIQDVVETKTTEGEDA